MKEKKVSYKTMSTNFQKQAKEAQKVFITNRVKVIRRAKKKRTTLQIRIPVELYRKVSERAKEEKKTRSKVIEYICRGHFS